MRDDLVLYLENNSLINDSQHGFRKGRSCFTNILSFLDKVTAMTDIGNSMDGIYLDFAKAFDKVPHQRLRAPWLVASEPRKRVSCSRSAELFLIFANPRRDG